MNDVYTDLKEMSVINYTLDDESIMKSVGKLDIHKNTILILRMEEGTTQQQIKMIPRMIAKNLNEKLGFEPIFVVIVGNTDLATTSREKLTRLRDDIDKILTRTDANDNEMEASSDRSNK